MEKKNEQKLVVIDSSIFIDHFRNYIPAVNFFSSLSDEEKKYVFFSAITESELISGRSCEDDSVKAKVLQMLNNFNKIEVNNKVAMLAGDLSRKQNILIPDAIIAATALVNNADLLTKNLKDFARIKDLKSVSPY